MTEPQQRLRSGRRNGEGDQSQQHGCRPGGKRYVKRGGGKCKCDAKTSQSCDLVLVVESHMRVIGDHIIFSFNVVVGLGNYLMVYSDYMIGFGDHVIVTGYQVMVGDNNVTSSTMHMRSVCGQVEGFLNLVNSFVYYVMAVCDAM
jgi:hypothetical protein